MSDTTKILLVLGGLAAVGLVIFLATQGSNGRTTSRTGPSSGFAGLVRSIGAGLTGITAAIVGTVEAEEAAAAETEAERTATEEASA